MKAVHKQIGTLLLLLSWAAAQNTSSGPATIQSIVVGREGGDLRVEIVLSSSVQASVKAAHHPDRLVLQLPNTIDATQRARIDVNTNGVRTIHTVMAFDDGKSTNVVFELDHTRSYALSSDKNQIVLIFAANANTTARSSGAMAAASTKGLGGLLHRQPKAQSTDSSSSANSIVPAANPGALSGAGAPQGSASSTTAVSHASSSTVPGGSSGVLPGSGAFQGVANSTSSVSGASGSTAPAATAGVLTRSGAGSGTPDGSTSTAASSPMAQVASVPQGLPTTFSPDGSAGQPFAITAAANNVAPTAKSANNTATNAAPATPRTSVNDPSPALALRASEPGLRTVFKVKYVAEGVAYLDGGRSSGLKEGVKLEIEETDLPVREGAAVSPTDPRVVAELEVAAVAETSAVTDIHSPKRPVKPGDMAYLSSSDAEALVQQTALSPTRKYPAVISFTSGDTLDDEVREEVPRPPMPSVNRARGRIGFDYMGTIGHGNSAITNSDYGMIFRGDITRINGTYWNLSGYWRGRFTSQSPAGQQTLQDLINRTYHLSMTYDNPNSDWVAGFGRLYLPWASSLDTIDGGYLGRRLSKTTTLGLFGGSTPDPTSYDYAPGQVISGGFINFEGGDYSGFHYSSTSGAGIKMLNWQLERPFGFLENTISYTTSFSIYDALQVDSPVGNPAVPAPGPGLSRNFLTLRVQPHPRLELDFNHTYFRDIPTFDPTLIGTGLLDKYLFQGFSVGARVEVMKQVFVYTQLGRSNRTGDAKSSLNELYGITFNHLPWFGLRADFHYAQFNSSFGSGKYKAFSLGRSFTDNFRLEVLAGDQSFASQMTSVNHDWFVTSNIETNFGPHYFIQGGYTIDRGQMSYDQWMLTLGYRFDSKARHRE